MINLLVPVVLAKTEIATIEHKNCQKGLTNGHFCPDGELNDESIYWFFCWARSGGGSERTRIQARQIWDNIFDLPYETLNEDRFYRFAQARRYR